jgi:hypothetical protein
MVISSFMEMLRAGEGGLLNFSGYLVGAERDAKKVLCLGKASIYKDNKGTLRGFEGL